MMRCMITTKKTDKDDANTRSEWVANSFAPEVLASLYPEAGKTPEQWATWLQNNRNNARQVPYRIPFERIEGLVVYAEKELEKFVEWDRRREVGTRTLSPRAAEALHAFGVGQAAGTTHGRRFAGGAANPQASEVDGSVFVQAIINEPLMVFKMTPEQAIDFGRELVEAGKAAQRIGGRQ
jgi:hypothetical protein